MAKKQGKVYLGYEDEIVSDKNKTLLNFTVNKIGGLPDWPSTESIQFSSKCPICSLHRLLVIQCYAPLENSIYFRTLYVFACINPNCWNQSESWSCIRCQVKDESAKTSAVVAMPSVESNLSWCTGSDNWDENDNGDSANGNVMNVDNAISPNIHRISDDDESNSYDLDAIEQALGNIQMYDAHNANLSPIQGAVGAIGVPIPAAELEGGDEPGLVTVETPTAPTNNIEALLHQTAELPGDLRSRLMCGPLQFVPKYIFVEEELQKVPSNDDRVAELLNKYAKESEVDVNVKADIGGGGDDELYEEATPLHGDRLFHAFMTRLQNNPGHILRYTRDEPPILGAPLPSVDSGLCTPTICTRCGSRLICELQLVPGFGGSLQILPGNNSLPYLHFLSVLIFTCSQSCWQPTDNFVAEIVVFQPEVI